MKPALFLSLALLLPAAAAANDAQPFRKAGLWSMTIEGSARPRIVQFCVDADSEQKSLDKFKSMAASHCSKVETHLSGNTFTSDSACDIVGAKRISHSVTTLVDDDTRVTVTSGKFDPPKPRLADHETKLTMKWLGPCGAGVKPGQMIVDGKVMTGPGL